jgi:hypothetical protein
LHPTATNSLLAIFIATELLEGQAGSSQRLEPTKRLSREHIPLIRDEPEKQAAAGEPKQSIPDH